MAKKSTKTKPKPKPKPKTKTKTKKKKKVLEPVSIAEWRGVGSFDTNEILVLVPQPVDVVAAAFQKHRKLKTRVADAAGKAVTVRDPSYVIYRLKGHNWTIIDSYQSMGRYPDAADAEALSKALKCRTIYYANSDTAGATGYDLFEDGKRVEHLECCEGLEFESSVRRVEGPNDGPDIYPFVERFMKDQDALAPSWSVYFGAICHKPGNKVKLDFFRADEVERVDYVSA
jgi:hypothetical protein